MKKTLLFNLIDGHKLFKCAVDSMEKRTCLQVKFPGWEDSIICSIAKDYVQVQCLGDT